MLLKRKDTFSVRRGRHYEASDRPAVRGWWERGVQGGAKLPPPTGGREAAGGRAFWSKEYCVLFVENKPTGTPGCFEKTFRCEERGELRSPRPPKYLRHIRPKTSRSTPGGQREPMAPLCKGSCLPQQTEGLPCGENSENLAPKKPKKTLIAFAMSVLVSVFRGANGRD